MTTSHLGINPEVARPGWTVLTVLPVPPVTMRPSMSLRMDNVPRMIHSQLVDIIRINQRFKENQDAGAPRFIIEDLWELLQYHVTTYLDNEVAGCPPARHRSGRPLKTSHNDSRGKTGGSGARSLENGSISCPYGHLPDPNLAVIEVGIPSPLQMRYRTKSRSPLQYRRPETDGIEWPSQDEFTHTCGANYVIRPDKRRLRLLKETLKRLPRPEPDGLWRDR